MGVPCLIVPRRLIPLALVVAVAVGPACSRHEFADRSAKLTVDGKTATYTVDSCGLDQRTVFVVAKDPSGAVIQAVVGVQKDHQTGVPSRTGLTVTSSSGWTNEAPNQGVIRTVELGAFGPGAWQLRKGLGSAPGTITSARIRGSRIQVAGSLEHLDDAGTAAADTVGSPDLAPFKLDARCDEKTQR